MSEGIRPHRKRPRSPLELRVTRRDSHAREEARVRMVETMHAVTDALVNDDIRSVYFEQCYRNIYVAVAQFKLGDEWFVELGKSVDRLVVAFHRDRAKYDVAIAVVRDMSMFADATYCRARGDAARVCAVFKQAWTTWHSDRTLRANALWARVRAVRLKVVAVATLRAMLEEIRLRPGGALFEDAREHFVANARRQQLH